MGLTVRWAVGSPKKRPLPGKARRIFAASLMGAKRLWPEARLVAQVNLGPSEQRSWLFGLCDRLGVESVDGLKIRAEAGEVAKFGLFYGGRGPWWKFVPPRFSPDDHELTLDSDLVLWKEPPAIEAWRRDPDAGMLGHANVGPRVPGQHWQFRGLFEDLIPKDLDLNSGLYGYGPGQPFNPPLARSSLPEGFTGLRSHQGYVGLSFFRAGTHRVSFDEVLLPLTEEEMESIRRPEVCGVHFITHAYEDRDLWSGFEDVVMGRLNDIPLG